MIILGLADIHGDIKQLEKMKDELEAADILLLVGDITNFGHSLETEAVTTFLRSCNDCILAVSGNCDYHEVDDYIDKEGINLHASSRMIDGIGFIGLGGSLITPFNTPNEFTEQDISKYLNKAVSTLPKGTPMVLVSHQPPLDTAGDLISSGDHVGSASVRKFIEDHEPLICFTGHIHEASSIDNIGNTPVINPGAVFQGKYAFADISSQINSLEIKNI